MIQLWPSFIPVWSDGRLHSPNPYFGGQDLGAVFAEVGREVPPEYQSPFRATFSNFIASTADGPNVLTGKIKPAAFLKYEAQRIRAKMKQIGT